MILSRERIAIAAYLAILQSPGTQRAYRSTLRALRAEFSPPDAPFTVAEFDTDASADRVTDWFTGRWGQRAPATFNRNLDALRSAVSYLQDQHWLSTDPTRRLRRRGRTPDRTRALSHSEIDALFDQDLALRERTLYTLLYSLNFAA
ncbi:hypothetical protein [Actinomadura litoris]|uniref:Core-binding (CB) domain-containing protein n=1 Tax=Actinomadura litoris TaxID=2678616 RepID=A0A7K1LBA3_9ACTN|nr:hypothetical protein [Actinomadura litoris]MUN41707.1 hypothetical protein [Actinomadura litoris]